MTAFDDALDEYYAARHSKDAPRVAAARAAARSSAVATPEPGEDGLRAAISRQWSDDDPGIAETAQFPIYLTVRTLRVLLATNPDTPNE